ncbi:MAG TPA: alpha/beta hydrolase [Chloroflexota bacterium]
MRLRALVRLPAAALVVAGLAYGGASAVIIERVTRAVRTPIDGTPADLGLGYESVVFESATDRVRLRGWYLPAQGRRAIIFVHGIDKNRWDSWEHIPQKARMFVEHGFDVLAFDLRGHGESGGERLGFGWLERRDVQGAVAFVQQRGIPAGRIGLQAHSYGAAVGLLSAGIVPDIGGVVADSGFADVRSLVERELQLRGFPPIFAAGISLGANRLYGISLDDIAPENQVWRIAPRPVLFIHGTADERIPVDNSYRLYAAARNPAAELWIVPAAAHVQAFTVDPEVYSERVLAFFDRSLR